MTKNLVTGGAGFIGSHLVERLLAAGESVEVIDDLSTGALSNLDSVKGHPAFAFHQGSIMDEALMERLITRTDRVWHLAAAVGVRLIVEKPVHTIETNIRGTETLLQIAARAGKSVLITSTSEVYGKSTQVPFSEEDNLVFGATTKPRWAYACSKAIDEFLALAYHQEFGTPVVVVRLFNTVGPRQTGQYGMVIPRFVKQALAGRPISIYGDGTQSRAFADVEDVVGCLTSLMGNPAAAGGVFNIGNNEEITIVALAEKIIQMTGSTSTLEFIPFEKAYDRNFEDLARRVPDLQKVQALTGYRPTRNIDAILRRIIDWHRQT